MRRIESYLGLTPFWGWYSAAMLTAILGIVVAAAVGTDPVAPGVVIVGCALVIASVGCMIMQVREWMRQDGREDREAQARR